MSDGVNAKRRGGICGFYYSCKYGLKCVCACVRVCLCTQHTFATVNQTHFPDILHDFICADSWKSSKAPVNDVPTVKGNEKSTKNAYLMVLIGAMLITTTVHVWGSSGVWKKKKIYLFHSFFLIKSNNQKTSQGSFDTAPPSPPWISTIIVSAESDCYHAAFYLLSLTLQWQKPHLWILSLQGCLCCSKT